MALSTNPECSNYIIVPASARDRRGGGRGTCRCAAGDRRTVERNPLSQRTSGTPTDRPLAVHLSFGGPTDRPGAGAGQGGARGRDGEGRAGPSDNRPPVDALIQSCEASITFGDLHVARRRRRHHIRDAEPNRVGVLSCRRSRIDCWWRWQWDVGLMAFSLLTPSAAAPALRHIRLVLPFCTILLSSRSCGCRKWPHPS